MKHFLAVKAPPPPPFTDNYGRLALISREMVGHMNISCFPLANPSNELSYIGTPPSVREEVRLWVPGGRNAFIPRVGSPPGASNPNRFGPQSVIIISRSKFLRGAAVEFEMNPTPVDPCLNNFRLRFHVSFYLL